MTKLPGNLRRGGTNFIMTRWRAADALALLAREQMTTVAGVPTQLALMLRQPDFDALRPRRRCSSSSSAADRSRPASPRRRAAASARGSSTRYSCTEAGIGLGTAFDDPDEDAIVSVGRPHPSVELALLDDDDRPGRRGRGRAGVPALPRGHVRATGATPTRPRPRSPPTASCAPATSAGSTTAAASVSSAAARRCTCAAATTCTRSRSRRVLSTHPGRRRGRDRAAPRRRDGRDRRRGRRAPRSAARAVALDDLRDLRRAAARRATSSPRRCTSSTRSRSPRWRRSTAARSPTLVARAGAQ